MARLGPKSKIVLLALVLQIILFFAFMSLLETFAKPGGTNWLEPLGITLFPGIQLFWHEGFHSDSAVLGLFLALAFNLSYYVLLILAGRWLWRKMKSTKSFL